MTSRDPLLPVQASALDAARYLPRVGTPYGSEMVAYART